MQLPPDMCMQLGSLQCNQDEHISTQSPLQPLIPVSSPAPTAQLSDVYLPRLEFYLNGIMCYSV